MKNRTLLLKILLPLLAMLLLLLFLKSCGSENEPKSTKKDGTTEKNVDTKIALKTLNNETILLEQTETGYLNVGSQKAILINFFTTDCTPCSAMIPHLNNLQKKYADNLTIISVLVESGLFIDEIEEYCIKNNINFVVTIDQNNLKLFNDIGTIVDIPNIFIYDKDGNFLENYVGAVPEEMIEADLIRML